MDFLVVIKNLEMGRLSCITWVTHCINKSLRERERERQRGRSGRVRGDVRTEAESEMRPVKENKQLPEAGEGEELVPQSLQKEGSLTDTLILAL